MRKMGFWDMSQNPQYYTTIERLLSDMDKIENYLKRIKVIRLLKAKVNDLMDTCLLYIRILYDSLNDFIFMEKHLWEAY